MDQPKFNRQESFNFNQIMGGDMMELPGMDLAKMESRQSTNFDSEMNNMYNNSNALFTSENFNSAMQYQNNQNSNRLNNNMGKNKQNNDDFQDLNMNQNMDPALNSNLDNNNNLSNINQNQEQQQIDSKLNQINQFLDHLSMNGNQYLKSNQQKSEQLIDFLVQSQDMIEDSLLGAKNNLKHVGFNRKANLKNTIQYAFNIQNSFLPGAQQNKFVSSYQIRFNPIPGRKCPLPTIKTNKNQKLNLEQQNVFKVNTDLIQIEPAPNTQVFFTTSQNTEKQFPIPFQQYVDHKTLYMNLTKFHPNTQTTIQLVVTKINCEESDLYQITIYPEGGENGIARPEFNVEGSHRREESWTHQYQFDNPNEPDQNAGLEQNDDIAAYFDE